MAKVCKACMGTGYAHGGEVDDDMTDDDLQDREVPDGIPTEENESDESEEDARKRQMSRFVAAMKARRGGKR
jgi:hypothetical protein